MLVFCLCGIFIITNIIIVIIVIVSTLVYALVVFLYTYADRWLAGMKKESFFITFYNDNCCNHYSYYYCYFVSFSILSPLCFHHFWLTNVSCYFYAMYSCNLSLFFSSLHSWLTWILFSGDLCIGF